MFPGMSESATPPRRVARPPAGRPLLLFDGECGFCRLWVERWRAAGNGRLDIAPSQEAGARFPEIPAAAFAHAVQLIDTDGGVTAAAEAILRARAAATHRSWLLAAYERVPGFARIAEGAYRMVANHRPLLTRLTRLFWGADVRRPTFGLSAWLFLRLLGVIHLIAFGSFWIQLAGLVGPHGIMPAQPYLDAVRDQVGAARFWALPTLCWFFGAGWFLHALCAAGVALGLALLAGVAPPACAALLWVAYLSLCAAGQVFLDYQWDALLLEATLLAVFLAPWSWRSWRRRDDPPRFARWLLWWLLIRLMLLSGVVKLLSGDPTWRNLTALTYHFQTQPLPTWMAWYAQQLPAWFLRLSCAIMFVIELGGPLLLLLPRRARHAGAALLIGMQALIALTGNYTFFNLLTVALCLLFFDDAFWRDARRRLHLPSRPAPADRPPARWCPRSVLRPAAGVALALTVINILPMLRRYGPWPGWMYRTLALAQPLRSFNTYGLFAVMTTERPEIILEGSDDGRTWLPYEFKAKPGDLRQRPGFVAPHQPRLDWQLWFAALDYPQRDPWVTSLCVRLLQGSPPVLALFASNPFPRRPPRQVRAVLYDYTFTNRATRTATGRWWDRTPVDLYVPPLSLR
jgi:predicted DCC family thiol-disulfide oxidoreductase YuxK